MLLADEELRALLVDIAARPDVRGLVNLVREGAVTTELLDAAKIVIARPEIATLIQRATATMRTQEAVEIAVANPEFAFFGSRAATERSVCAWLARLLLRVSKTRTSDNDG